VLLLAPVAGWRIRSDVRAFSWRDVALILGAGVLLGIHFLAWIESLYHTTVASASVLVTTSPIFLVVLGFLVLKERLSWTTVAAICVSVVGAALIGIGDARGVGVGPNPLWGNSLALSASLFASVYLLIGRVVRQQVPWLAYVFPLYSVAALTTLGAAWMQGVPLFGYEAGFYGLCLLMAIGPQILGHGSFNYALHYFPAALVGMLALLEPVGSSALAFVLFGEVPNALAITGMLVVLGAVGVVVWNERQRAPADQER
jgi:drug/metabolite transporter (DMT)-like permease